MIQILINDIPVYIRIMRLDRPIGMLLLLWPTLWALWLSGDGRPDPTIVLIIIAGTVVMRAAGCIINDYADRNLDLYVTRTSMRPLANGSLNISKAMGLCFLLLLIALWLVTRLNQLSIIISVVALAVVVVYPFAKRFTHLPQLVLGVAFSMGIPISYAAVRNELPTECWLLFAANFLWIIAYDTYYAMADIKDDLLIGIKSTAILFGKSDRAIILVLQMLSLVILAYIGINGSLSWHYYIGLIIAAYFVLYQQYLTRERDPQQCLAAFLNNNWYGAVIHCGLVLGQTAY